MLQRLGDWQASRSIPEKHRTIPQRGNDLFSNESPGEPRGEYLIAVAEGDPARADDLCGNLTNSQNQNSA
jgi:hypothetical protein